MQFIRFVVEKLKEEIIEFFIRTGSWLFWIGIGVAAKIAFDSKGKVLTRKEKIIKVVISAFVGYLIAQFFTYKHWEASIKIAVPVATLVGESVIEFLMENSKTILKALFKKNLDIDTKD